MAISSLPCIQPVRVPFKACSFFPAGVCGGFNNKKRINAVVFSSLRKISNDINIESKVLFSLMCICLMKQPTVFSNYLLVFYSIKALAD
uniref:Uncharacterized protein n=2 Tax=Gossypium TaxID=3633 RepID=A0A0D2W6Y5_GOSRA|nr:hypothetical protein B456_013G170600 [Gossypium raimondii]